MKLAITILLCSTSLLIACNNRKNKHNIATTPEANNPLSELVYDSVIAYDYDGSDQRLIIDDSGNLAKTIINKVSLSDSKVKDIVDFLGNASTYGGEIPKCFDPHLGIVFYKQNKPIEYISICLDCNSLNSFIPIPVSGGFSEKGRQKISSLCKELHFSHCLDTLNKQFNQ